MRIQQSERYVDDNWWEWSVWIEGAPNELDAVNDVEWRLHPTFPKPIRKVTDRSANFKLETSGWGVFPIHAYVHLKDGRTERLQHDLELHFPEGHSCAHQKDEGTEKLPQEVPDSHQNFIGKALPLSETGLAKVCELLGIRAAEIWTALHFEARGCGFLPDRRPLILFERHIFSQKTNCKFDMHAPDISNRRPGGYGPGGAHQYDRLTKAMGLDEQAALESASWGIGQIIGFNAKNAGFPNVREMISAMLESEDNQLIAMANFLKSNKLDAALQSHDWPTFASGYKGPNFEQNNYDMKLQAAFAQYSTLLPDLNIREAQVFLTYRGLAPGAIDGFFGPRTRSALEQFQENEGLPITGNADVTTLGRLRNAVS